MSGEIAIQGIFIPALLALAALALAASFLTTRVLAHFGLYRFVANRALVDVALFVMLLGLFVRFAPLVSDLP